MRLLGIQNDLWHIDHSHPNIIIISVSIVGRCLITSKINNFTQSIHNWILAASHS